MATLLPSYPHCSPYAGKERRPYEGEQSAFLQGTDTALHTFNRPAHRLFTHASAPKEQEKMGTNTNTHTNMPPLNWSCTPGGQRAGWQEIRAEVSQGWKEGQPK